MRLLYNATKGIEIARVRIAKSFLSRALGLMFRRIEDDEGLLIEFPGYLKKPALHSFFMLYPIYLIFLDEEFKVVELGYLKPWRIYMPKTNARAVVELAKEPEVDIGDRLELR